MKPADLDLLRRSQLPSIFVAEIVHDAKPTTLCSHRSLLTLLVFYGLKKTFPQKKCLVEKHQQKDLSRGVWDEVTSETVFLDMAAAAAHSVATGEPWVEGLVPVPACHHSSPFPASRATWGR